MWAKASADDFEGRFGVRYLPHLRDGADFTGRARRIARRLGLEQDRADQALFAAHGGVDTLRERVLGTWRNLRRPLTTLTRAEERLFLCLALEAAFVAPTEVRPVDAQVGFGLFTTADLRRGEVIGEYTGVLRPYREEDADNAYLAQTPAYGRVGGLIIDGRDEGNVTRFINHGVDTANVVNHFVFHEKRWHRVLRTTRDVRVGEQLLTDYGEDYWRPRGRPLDL